MKHTQYNQQLSPKLASEGIIAAIENATSLLDDAFLLLNNKRYERSVALSILAIEESGKSAILRGILLEDDPKVLKKEWQNYRKHTEKNVTWIVPDLIANGARHLEDLRFAYDKDSDHRFELDQLKQLAFYTDIFSTGKWTKPKNVITKEIAERIFSVAKIMVNSETPMITKDQLEIWVKYMKPVWKKDMPSIKQALIKCYEEAEEKGLIQKGISANMSSFIQ